MTEYRPAFPTPQGILLRIFNYVAEDGLKLDGVLFSPASGMQNSRIAFLICTGLQDYALGRTATGLAQYMAKNGYTSIIINKRNSHVHYSQSLFEDVCFDISGALNYLLGEGYPNVIIVGHSLGSTETLYYLATRKPEHVLGLVMAGAPSDIRGKSTLRFFSGNPDPQEAYEEFLSKARELVEAGSGDAILDLQRYLGPDHHVHIPTSAKTFVNYRSPESNCSAIKWIGKVQVPMLLVGHESDPFGAGVMLEENHMLIEASRASEKLEYVFVPGANHYFENRIAELGHAIFDWVQEKRFLQV